MIPDIKTLMLLYLIINIISAGAVAVVWSQNRGRYAGISLWLVFMALQASGSLLIILRGLIPDFISIVIANVMIVSGLVILLVGLERFVGKKGWQIHNYILLAVYCLYTYYNSINPNLAERNIALSIIGAILTFQCCWLLLRRADPGIRRITLLTGIVLAFYFISNLARILLIVIFPEQTNDFFKSGAVGSLAVTVTIVLSVCLTISLVLMVNRRLLMDVKAQEEKFTVAFHSFPYAITLSRMADSKILEVNNGFADVTGYQPVEVIGKAALDLYMWVREEDRLRIINELSIGNDIHGMEIQFCKKTGDWSTGLFSASQVMINNEKCIVASVSDITGRKHAEEALHESEEKYRILVENANDIVYSLTLEGIFTYVSPTWTRILGYDISEVENNPIHSFIHAEDLPGFLEFMDRTVKTGKKQAGIEYRVRHKDNTWRWHTTNASPIYNSDGKVISFMGIARDITERKLMEQQLLQMATHDSLTNLPNRTLLYDRFQIALADAQRANKKLAIMSLDIDYFKTVNDSLGHDMGDKLLIAAASRLNRALRKSDTVARIGGDEFILLLREVGEKEDAVKVAEKILEDFRQPFLLDAHSINVTVSIGISIFPDNGKDIEDLLKSSDQSLYVAKESGRDRFVLQETTKL